MKDDHILLSAMKRVCTNPNTSNSIKRELTNALKEYLNSEKREYVQPELNDECYLVANPEEHYKIIKYGIIMEGIQLVDVLMTNGQYIGTQHYNVPINQLSKL